MISPTLNSSNVVNTARPNQRTYNIISQAGSVGVVGVVLGSAAVTLYSIFDRAVKQEVSHESMLSICVPGCAIIIASLGVSTLLDYFCQDFVCAEKLFNHPLFKDYDNKPAREGESASEYNLKCVRWALEITQSESSDSFGSFFNKTKRRMEVIYKVADEYGLLNEMSKEIDSLKEQGKNTQVLEFFDYVFSSLVPSESQILKKIDGVWFFSSIVGEFKKFFEEKNFQNAEQKISDLEKSFERKLTDLEKKFLKDVHGRFSKLVGDAEKITNDNYFFKPMFDLFSNGGEEDVYYFDNSNDYDNDCYENEENEYNLNVTVGNNNTTISNERNISNASTGVTRRAAGYGGTRLRGDDNSVTSSSVNSTSKSSEEDDDDKKGALIALLIGAVVVTVVISAASVFREKQRKNKMRPLAKTAFRFV